MRVLRVLVLSLVVLGISFSGVTAGNSAPQGEAKKNAVLKAADITAKIFPDKVYYRGQAGAVQMRNTGGVHFGDDAYVLAGLVDTSGYASGLKEKYQGYLLTEVPLDINGQVLKPGGYGIGFLAGSKFVVSDIGSNNVLEVAGQRDAELKRAVPLQVIAASDADSYRLYIGKDFITLKRAH